VVTPTTEEVADATARLLIRFQESVLQQLIESSSQSRQQLDGLVQGFSQAAMSAWQNAGSEARDFLLLVIANNPDRPIGEILNRPDVRSALRYPFEEAASMTNQSITASWSAGQDNGLHAAATQADIAGFEMPDDVPGPDQAYLQSLLDDVNANQVGARDRFLAALQNPNRESIGPALQAITNDLGYRARAGITVAGQRAAAEQQELAYAAIAEHNGVELRKLWVTRFGPGTCKTCAALHGTVRKLGEAFPEDAHFGSGSPPAVYGDLNHPPRHPNCRCRIVLFTPEMTKGGGPTPKSMVQFAMNWFSEFLRGVAEGFRGRR
jgi:hypothetical protein